MFKTLKTVHITIILFLIKLFGVCFSIFIFHKFSPLIDANLYIDHFYSSTREIRTRTVQEIVLLFSVFNEIVIHYVFGCISLIGFFYALIKFNFKPILLIFLLLPSSIVWTSIVGKEAIYFGFFTLLIFIWITALNDKLKLIDLILFIFSVIVCLVFRPHYLICIFWLYFSLIIIKYFFKYKNIVLFFTFLGLVILCLNIVYSDEILWRAVSLIDYYSRSARFVHYNILPPEIAAKIEFYDQIFLSFKDAIIKDWIYSIIGPRFDELFVRIEFIPYFIEGFLILSFPLMMYIYALKRNIDEFKKFNMLYLYSLIPALCLIILVHIPFGILNPGTGIRWRVNFESIFYLTPMLIYFNYKNLKIK